MSNLEDLPLTETQRSDLNESGITTLRDVANTSTKALAKSGHTPKERAEKLRDQAKAGLDIPVFTSGSEDQPLADFRTVDVPESIPGGS